MDSTGAHIVDGDGRKAAHGGNSTATARLSSPGANGGQKGPIEYTLTLHASKRTRRLAPWRRSPTAAWPAACMGKQRQLGHRGETRRRQAKGKTTRAKGSRDRGEPHRRTDSFGEATVWWLDGDVATKAAKNEEEGACTRFLLRKKGNPVGLCQWARPLPLRLMAWA